MKSFTLINIPELSTAQDEFVQIDKSMDLSWVKLSGIPRNWLERNIRKPKLSRYRGALEAVLATRKHLNPVIISHMPTMTAAVGMLSNLGTRHKRHIAFSFNFTDLPSAKKREYFKKTLKDVDKFIVFSEYEKGLYSNYFDLPLEKFTNVLWTQTAPPTKDLSTRIFPEPYLCAIGGEGRDFRTLLYAAQKSGVPLVIIARPSSIGDLHIPANVKIFCNLPLDETWGIAKESAGVIVPLKTPETCCGQITVVSACMLGLPLLSNCTHALQEYIIDDSATLTFDFGNSDDLANKMLLLISDQENVTKRATEMAGYYSERYSRKLWSTCITQCLDGFQ
jgi:hypothetical protein